VLHVFGRLDDVLAHARGAATGLPDEPLVQLNARLLEQDLGDLEQAAEGYEALARRWPQLAVMLYHLGHARLVQGRPDEAEPSLRQWLGLDARNTDAYHALVALHLRRAEPAQALDLVDAHRRRVVYDGYHLALR